MEQALETQARDYERLLEKIERRAEVGDGAGEGEGDGEARGEEMVVEMRKSKRKIVGEDDEEGEGIMVGEARAAKRPKENGSAAMDAVANEV